MPATAMVTVAEIEKRRLVEFVGDVSELADQRPDLELHDLVTDLHADLLRLRGADDE